MQGSTQVKANDPDEGDTHTFVVSKDGAHGTVYMGADGMLVYVPQPDFAGVDQFEITATDSQGVTAATLVSAAVRLAPADASAVADLVTFKNTPGAYVVFAETGVPGSFQVSEAPAHGTAEIDAQGMLTFAPEEGYAGDDAVGVSIALTNGDVTDVTVSVKVVNRAPKPTVAGIHITTGTAGNTTVRAGDPDPRDLAVYSIVTPPSRGTASVDGQGQVTYLPSEPHGEDSFTVKVVDGSGAAGVVAVDVTVRLPAATGFTPDGAFPPEICADGIERVLITAIDPPPMTMNSSWTVTATLAYSLNTTSTIGLTDLSSGPITATSVAPGCGTVTVSGNVPSAGTSGAEISPFPFAAQRFTYPFVTLGELKQTGYWTESIGGPVVDYFIAFEESLRFLYQLLNFTDGVSSFSRFDFEAANMTLHVRTHNACNKGIRQIQFSGQTLGITGGTFAGLNSPPAIQITPLLTNLPVTSGTTYTVDAWLKTCGAPLDVTVSASHDWFALSATTVTLNTDANIVVTVDGAKLAHAGLSEGVLRIHPADSSFADIEVPVSAYRFDSIDPAQYTPVWIAGGAWSATKDVQLPWAFPFAGVTYPTMKVLPDGSICGAPFGQSCQNIGLVILGGLDSYAPGFSGGPIFAPYWAPLLLAHNIAGENKTGLYYRNTNDTADPHAEFLWWDVATPFVSDSHNVIRFQLYPDGRFAYDYPHVQPSGLEVATWWYLLNNPGFEKQGADLRSGDRFSFGPVE
jgi:hypothetical protein